MEEKLTLGEKLKRARKEAGLTQEQLANELMVSRQAVTKWESDKGLPDIENLKRLAELLNVSIDYLLDDGKKLDLKVTRDQIDLDKYTYDRKKASYTRASKKAGQKDMAVREKYPNAQIIPLLATAVSSKADKIIDNAAGFVFGTPFGIPQMVNNSKLIDKEFYLVKNDDKTYLVMVTNEFLEARQITEPTNGKSFIIDNLKFTLTTGKL
ncbi:MAG: helix-turn-helix domain-containing protein [Ruminococcus sp.]|nr:helix-turn-helix domain-containing protein [Ruminococcus sp.]